MKQFLEREGERGRREREREKKICPKKTIDASTFSMVSLDLKLSKLFLVQVLSEVPYGPQSPSTSTNGLKEKMENLDLQWS